MLLMDLVDLLFLERQKHPMVLADLDDPELQMVLGFLGDP
jgi:hypothetical protein